MNSTSARGVVTRATAENKPRVHVATACFFSISLLLFSLWTKAVVTGVVPPPPPGPCLHFYRPDCSAFPPPAYFRRILPAHSLVLLARPFLHKNKSLRVTAGMHLGRIGLSKSTLHPRCGIIDVRFFLFPRARFVA